MPTPSIMTPIRADISRCLLAYPRGTSAGGISPTFNIDRLKLCNVGPPAKVPAIPASASIPATAHVLVPAIALAHSGTAAAMDRQFGPGIPGVEHSGTLRWPLRNLGGSCDHTLQIPPCQRSQDLQVDTGRGGDILGANARMRADTAMMCGSGGNGCYFS
jgi:hypothetical protein